MAQLETWIRQDLKNPLQVQYLNGTMFSQDNAANLVGVEVFDDGEPATLGGSVSANVVRSDGGTVAVSGGTLSGNRVSVILPQAAYAIPGAISIIIKLTAGGTVTTLGAIVVTVYRSSTDEVVDPGTIIPSVQNLISQIETVVASIPADYSSLWASLAPAFSTSTAYTAGQHMTYNGHLYRFTADHAAGSFVNTDCTQVDVGSELSSLKSALNNKANKEDLVSWLIGKKVSIIGDSIDTFNESGYKIDGYAMYYPALGVTDVKQTWWYQVISAIGSALEVNASWSGSRVTDTHSDPAFPDFYDRVTVIGNPDLIFVTLGTNDYSNGVALGEYDFETAYTSLSESQFRPAYIKGVKALQATYPNAKIICISEQMGESYKESVRYIAETLGAIFIDASDYIGSAGVHPGPYGMSQIARLILFRTDPTLSKEHVSADAKKTGDEINATNAVVKTVDGDQKSASGTSSKYISMAVSAGDTFVFRNTGSGVVGIVKSQLNGANVEDVLANLAAHKDTEWTATSAADRFYIYFNSSSELVVFRKNSLRYNVYASEEQIEANKSAAETNASEIDVLQTSIGNALEDTKDSAGYHILNYNVKAGVQYRIRTGAGILGWLKTMTSNNADVEVIMQNVLANTDMVWTATYDAPKIYVYFNSASSFSIVENTSVKNDIIVLGKNFNSKFVNQGVFEKNSSGNSYNAFKVESGHTYAICNNGKNNLGQISTLTTANAKVEDVKTTATQPGEMVIWTASQDAAKIYIYFNGASVATVYDMGAFQSKIEQVLQSITVPYNSISTYAVGDLVTHEFRLWKCNSAIATAEEWNPAHWELATIIETINAIVDGATLAEQVITPDYTAEAVATGAYISEDMSIVGDELWLFTQSTAVGGDQNGYISMIDKSNYGIMNHRCTHNLGHCGTTDYDSDNDRMLICGADNGTADTPYMYIYHDVSDWKNLSAIAYADQIVDRIDLSALASVYGYVTYLAACWGPRTVNGDKLVYLYGGNKWYLLLMGIGTNELEMGTYTAASAGRYNGTYKVLNHWTYKPRIPWEAYDDVMQGIKMHNGIVYTSNGHRATTIREWIFKDNHIATVKQHRTPWVDNSGAHTTAQGQGIDFNDDKLIVAISTGYISTLL